MTERCNIAVSHPGLGGDSRRDYSVGTHPPVGDPCAVPGCPLRGIHSVSVGRGEYVRVCGEHYRAVTVGELELRMASEEEPIDLEAISRLVRAVWDEPGVIAARLAQEVGIDLHTLRAHLPADTVRQVGARLYPVQSSGRPDAHPSRTLDTDPPAPSEEQAPDPEDTMHRDDLTPAQRETLEAVTAHPGLITSELARVLGISVPAARGRLVKLERHGYVVPTPTATEDGHRTHRWTVTEETPEPPPADPALLAKANRALVEQLAELRTERDDLRKDLEVVSKAKARAEVETIRSRLAEARRDLEERKRNWSELDEEASKWNAVGVELGSILTGDPEATIDREHLAALAQGVVEQRDAALGILGRLCHQLGVAVEANDQAISAAPRLSRVISGLQEASADVRGLADKVDALEQDLGALHQMASVPCYIEIAEMQTRLGEKAWTAWTERARTIRRDAERVPTSPAQLDLWDLTESALDGNRRAVLQLLVLAGSAVVGEAA